ncbi:MAG: endonuclease [Kouleothrix sp.]|nr:endonuclease [Kouleothrix sp.]
MTSYLCYADRPASVVYLLHFEAPISPRHTCQHYLGFARAKDFGPRLEEHRRGRGARLTQVAYQRGIGFTLARVWYGDRTFERRLKRRKMAPRMCPICTGKRNLQAIDDLL